LLIFKFYKYFQNQNFTLTGMAFVILLLFLLGETEGLPNCPDVEKKEFLEMVLQANSQSG